MPSAPAPICPECGAVCAVREQPVRDGGVTRFVMCDAECAQCGEAWPVTGEEE